MPQSKLSPAKLEAARRRALAFELRSGGATFQQIADRLQISVPSAYNLVKRAVRKLAESNRKDADLHLSLELDRLDLAVRTLYRILTSAEATNKDKIAAAQALARIDERRAKLLALDAPQQVSPVNPDGTPYAGVSDQDRAAAIMAIMARQTQPEATS